MPSDKTRVGQEEIFGPFAAFQIFDRFDEALAIANDSEFGLVSYLWRNNLTQAQSGVVPVNTLMWLGLRFPFGGYKTSDVGREGIDGMRHFYTEEKRSP